MMLLALLAQATGHGPAAQEISPILGAALIVAAGLLAILIALWLTIRYIPNDSVGIVEKLWSRTGSVAEGSIIALGG